MPIQAASAEEAIYKVIHERKISNKINYDVLNDLKCQSGLQPATPVDSQPPPTPLQTEDLSEASRSGIHFFYFHKCDLLLKVHVLKKTSKPCIGRKLANFLEEKMLRVKIPYKDITTCISVIFIFFF